jgi:hypothetical protein
MITIPNSREKNKKGIKQILWIYPMNSWKKDCKHWKIIIFGSKQKRKESIFESFKQLKDLRLLILFPLMVPDMEKTKSLQISFKKKTFKSPNPHIKID